MKLLIILLSLLGTAFAVCFPDYPLQGENGYSISQQYTPRWEALQNVNYNPYQLYGMYGSSNRLVNRNEGLDSSENKGKHQLTCYPEMASYMLGNGYYNQQFGNQICQEIYSPQYLEYIDKLKDLNQVEHFYGLNGEYIYGKEWKNWRDIYSPKYISYLENLYGPGVIEKIKFSQIPFSGEGGVLGNVYYDQLFGNQVWQQMYSPKYLQYLQNIKDLNQIEHSNGLNGEYVFGNGWKSWRDIYSPTYIAYLETIYGPGAIEKIKFGQTPYSQDMLGIGNYNQQSGNQMLQERYSPQYLQYIQNINDVNQVERNYGLNGEYIFGKDWKSWRDIYSPKYIAQLEAVYGPMEKLKFGQFPYAQQGGGFLQNLGNVGQGFWQSLNNNFNGNGFLQGVNNQLQHFVGHLGSYFVPSNVNNNYNQQFGHNRPGFLSGLLYYPWNLYNQFLHPVSGGQSGQTGAFVDRFGEGNNSTEDKNKNKDNEVVVDKVEKVVENSTIKNNSLDNNVEVDKIVVEENPQEVSGQENIASNLPDRMAAENDLVPEEQKMVKTKQTNWLANGQLELGSFPKETITTKTVQTGGDPNMLTLTINVPQYEAPTISKTVEVIKSSLSGMGKKNLNEQPIQVSSIRSSSKQEGEVEGSDSGSSYSYKLSEPKFKWELFGKDKTSGTSGNSVNVLPSTSNIEPSLKWELVSSDGKTLKTSENEENGQSVLSRNGDKSVEVTKTVSVENINGQNIADKVMGRTQTLDNTQGAAVDEKVSKVQNI